MNEDLTYCCEPTNEELRSSARTMRLMKVILDDIYRSWTWWEKLIYERPGKYLLDYASRFDSMADIFERNNEH